MYQITGVAQPRLDIAYFEKMKTYGVRLQQGLLSARAGVSDVVSTVLAENNGPAADAFSSKIGSTVQTHLSSLSLAATRTVHAYETVVRDGGSAKTAMDTLARQYLVDLATLIQETGTSQEINALIDQARSELVKLEQHATSTINAAFDALALPGPIQTAENDTYGHIDPAIVEFWNSDNLDDEQRKQILQKIADDYAKENGFPPIEITFEPIDEEPNTVTWGQYNNGTQQLTLNTDELSDGSQMINTVVHEMQHRAQYCGMGFRWPWEDEKNGMSREDAERWRRMNEGHVRMKGDDPTTDVDEAYYPRPIEVDARRAGRNFVENLTYAEFEERYL